MINPTDTDIDRKVVYRDRSGHVVEEGVITSFNDTCVFVRYGSDAHSKGTRREDLEWISKNGAVAESIIRCEGLTFALAVNGKEADLREARKFLKERIVKELGAAEARGVVAGVNATSMNIIRD